MGIWADPVGLLFLPIPISGKSWLISVENLSFQLPGRYAQTLPNLFYQTPTDHFPVLLPTTFLLPLTSPLQLFTPCPEAPSFYCQGSLIFLALMKRRWWCFFKNNLDDYVSLKESFIPNCLWLSSTSRNLAESCGQPTLPDPVCCQTGMNWPSPPPVSLPDPIA